MGFRATEPCLPCRPRLVRKLVVLFAAIAVVAAAVAAVVGLWLPAWEQRQDAAWAAAGERALAQVALPSSYSPIRADGNLVLCGGDPRTERCFLGPGDPKEQLATVKAALAAVASGPMDASCHPVPTPPGGPPSCFLRVPVAGSRLVVFLFAHPRDRSKHITQWTYDGAYVQLIVAPR